MIRSSDLGLICLVKKRIISKFLRENKRKIQPYNVRAVVVRIISASVQDLREQFRRWNYCQDACPIIAAVNLLIRIKIIFHHFSCFVRCFASLHVYHWRHSEVIMAQIKTGKPQRVQAVSCVEGRYPFSHNQQWDWMLGWCFENVLSDKGTIRSMERNPAAIDDKELWLWR